MVVLMLAAGCGQASGAPATPARTLADPTALPTLAVAPSWTVALAGPLSATLAGDGSIVGGSSPSGPWAYTAAGTAVPLVGVTGGAVWPLPSGLLAVGPGVADPAGPAVLLDADGQQLWSAAAVGPVVAVAAPDGGRVALLDAGAGTATELLPGAAGAIQGLSLGAGLSAQLDRAGDALVLEAGRAALYSPAGVQRWSQPLQPNAPPRSFVLDQNGAGVTVATTGTDHSLYQFDVAGSSPGVAWSAALPPGGSNLLAAGPKDRVIVWGLGGTATLAVFAEQDGIRLWQDTIPAPTTGSADQGTPSIRAAAFTADGGLAVAVDDCLGSAAPCVLLLGPAGRALAVVPLPLASSVTLAANGEAAVTVLPAAGGEQVAWYALPSHLPPAAGSSAGVSASGQT